MARANAFCVKPIGSMKSKSRTSPGVGFAISSVVVDDFDMIRPAFSPNEAYAPLAIDTDTMLSGAITFQRFQVIARWNCKIPQRHCIIQNPQALVSSICAIVAVLRGRVGSPTPRSRGARNLCIGVMQPAYTHGTPAMPQTHYPLPPRALSAILPGYPGPSVAG
jgi:hypothetical protein